jgi:hypothetical protein
LAAITYRLIENPVRHTRVLARHTGLTLAIGAILIIVTLGIGCARYVVSGCGDRSARRCRLAVAAVAAQPGVRVVLMVAVACWVRCAR